jgi:hypothetical protein
MLAGLIAFAIGAILFLVGLRRGEFPSRWPFPPATRDHPATYWTSALSLIGISAIGLYLMLASALGWPTDP